MRKLLILMAAAVAMSCGKGNAPAEIVVYGKIWTGNEKQPLAEAMAINADTIIAVGSRSDISKYAGDKTEVIEAATDQLVVPGFIDTHTHFVDGGFRLQSVLLRDAKTPKEFIQRISDYGKTLPAGEWIVGGDWDHENWGGELPDRNWIDSVTKDHPVWVTRLDGHMSLANTAAIKAAGIDDKVKDVPGGTIVRSKGRMTGVFKDNATTYIERVIPAPGAVLEDRALDTAMAYVASKGVTSAHNMSGFMDALDRAHKAGRLKTRIYAGMPLTEWRTLDARIKSQGAGDNWLRVGNLKAFVDGSLGSHTAAFHKGFVDAPKDSGFFVTPPEELYKLIKSADSARLNLMIHAIGDRAINSLLNIFERVDNENEDWPRRFRIEHAQHISPEDFPRFAQLGVIASMQPYHAIDDGRWADKIIGPERSKTTYAFKSLMDANAIVSFGSDWFVAPPTPLEGIYAAVTRRTLDDKNPDGWVPEQKVTVEQALKAYTTAGAYASFEEDIKGSLEPGKLADFVILGSDITVIDPVKIRDVKVVRTVVGGKTVFSDGPH
ncbi:MAG TPA: amidohydrolase family protein [Cyclobacteriaceae bacterium]|nr:amidohydrolase family protein [Cyclobacteriaceae bacterium]